MADATLFPTIDITSAYAQVPVAELSFSKVAVVTKFGLY